jgi:galactose mutarotase-like enzyme
VQSDSPSVIGLHYYYALPSTGGTIKASVENSYRIQDNWKRTPSSLLDNEGSLLFDATQEADFGFIPKSKNGFFEILYENADYTLKIRFQTEDEEASFQIYRPKDASYICIEPLSAKDPKKPLLKSSRLKVFLELV